jgi:hypothetical protein
LGSLNKRRTAALVEERNATTRAMVVFVINMVGFERILVGESCRCDM